MTIKAINATTAQLSKSLKRSLINNGFAAMRAYTENSKIFQHNTISAKAITAELCDRFSTAKNAKMVDSTLLDKYDLLPNASLKTLSATMVERYNNMPTSDKNFDPGRIFPSKKEFIEYLEGFIKEAETLRKQTSSDIKKACKRAISASREMIDNLTD